MSKWLSFGENKELFNKEAKNNCLCKFADGSVCRYNEEHPMQILTHFKLTITDDLEYFQQKLLNVFKCGDNDDPEHALKKLGRIEKAIVKDSDDLKCVLEPAVRIIKQYATLKKYG